ncbi:BppU family phage baseplate upper protein [Enterococcus devriesei]|uniref:glycerophosphodiester phosphodiesterase family protein n=1 Tax=Enterococcus devriesei TaxID=319970 RepID=UPI001C0F7C72|nr:glycerophosphodiester phosphodiesterase family protein [Enterococcus devriesei]MBU5364301.1 BppU family phage baseplate upper protein [Enterococcus devriesei]
MTNKILNLDISKEPKLNPIIYGRVGDGDSQRITVNTSRRDEQLDLTGYTITFEGVTSGGKTKVFDSDNVITVSDGLKKGTFDYVFPNMAFAVSGKYERAYFSFIKDGIRDTSGEIEIIVLDNADIDAAEAETIITEYNKLVTELRKLQDQAIADMNQNFAATQAKISELEKQLSDTQSELQQALKDFENGNFWTKEESFNKEETSANVIYQAIGKETVKIPIIFDFEGKIATSNVENPHRRMLYSGSSLGASANFGEHNGQEAYDKTTKLDGVVDTRATNISGNMRQERMDWNIVAGLTKILGVDFFSDQGVSTTIEKVRFIRSITKKINPIIYGRGSSVGGNKLTHKRWFGSWEIGGTSTTSSSIAKLELPAENENAINSYIQDNGFGSNMVFAEASDGAILSTVIIDYACLELTIELSLNQYFKTLIATNHVQNLATQAEAENATDNNKTMTPLRTKQQLDKRIANQTEAENSADNTKIMTPLRTKQAFESFSSDIPLPSVYGSSFHFCAHRGNNSDYPENSAPALKTVTRHHFTEFDICITKDGQWVVMHDDTVDRMTNGTGRVDSLTYAQIRALRIDAGSNLSTLTDAEKIIPSLEEAIKYCKQTGSVPFIEIKSNTYTDENLQSFLDILRKNNILNGGCVVISFDKSILERLRNMSNKLEIAWVMNAITQTELNECIRLRMAPDVEYSNANVTKAMVEACHNAGLAFGVWTAPDSAFDSLIDKGVDVITTNSRSGDLRWSEITLVNGYTYYSSGDVLRKPFVEEISRGVARVTFTISNGSNDKGTKIMSLPAWAVPTYSSWHTCTIRAASTPGYATIDLLGKLSGSAGDIVVGLEWAPRTIWANGSFTYDLY